MAGGNVLLVVCVGLLLVPPTAGLEFERVYEMSATYATGDPAQGGAFHSAAFCMGGHDTPADAGGCIRYLVPGLFDLTGEPFVVQIDDALFAASTWAVVTVDVDGDGSVVCGSGLDRCYVGQGTITGEIPSEAVGGYLRVFPVTVYTDDTIGVPLGFASRGTIFIDFPEHCTVLCS